MFHTDKPEIGCFLGDESSGDMTSITSALDSLTTSSFPVTVLDSSNLLSTTSGTFERANSPSVPGETQSPQLPAFGSPSTSTGDDVCASHLNTFQSDINLLDEKPTFGVLGRNQSSGESFDQQNQIQMVNSVSQPTESVRSKSQDPAAADQTITFSGTMTLQVQPSTDFGIQANQILITAAITIPQGLFQFPCASSPVFGQMPNSQAPVVAGDFSSPTTGFLNQPSHQGRGLFSTQTGSGNTSTNNAPSVGFSHNIPTSRRYSPVHGSDVVVRNGSTYPINTLVHCITCMKECVDKSLEELRFEDYTANKKNGFNCFVKPTDIGNTSTLSTGFAYNSSSEKPFLMSAFNPFSKIVGEAKPFGGTAQVFMPVKASDTMVKNGTTQMFNTLVHCITCMKEYENKSLEELRFEDYTANKKNGFNCFVKPTDVGTTSTSTLSTGFAFNSSSDSSTLPFLTSAFNPFSKIVGEAKPFGRTSQGFRPVIGNDTLVKNGIPQNVNTRLQCISCMDEYEGRSIDELRLEDYVSNRRYGSTRFVEPTGFGPSPRSLPPGSIFGVTQQTLPTPSLFGGTPHSLPALSLFGGTQQPTRSPVNASRRPTVKGSRGAQNVSADFQTWLGNLASGQVRGPISGFGFGAQRNQGVGLFGQKNPPLIGQTVTFGGFGNPAGQVFGNTAPTYRQTPQDPAPLMFGTGGGFGNSAGQGFGNTAPTFRQTPQTHATLMFGTGGGFGNPAGQGFGNTAPTCRQTPQTPATLMFGTAGGGFGNPAGQGFGNTAPTCRQTPQTPATLMFGTGGGFGNSAGQGFGNTGSSFGQSSQHSFGENPNWKFHGGGFGTSTPPSFGNAAPSFSQAPQATNTLPFGTGDGTGNLASLRNGTGNPALLGYGTGNPAPSGYGSGTTASFGSGNTDPLFDTRTFGTAFSCISPTPGFGNTISSYTQAMPPATTLASSTGGMFGTSSIPNFVNTVPSYNQTNPVASAAGSIPTPVVGSGPHSSQPTDAGNTSSPSPFKISPPSSYHKTTAANTSQGGFGDPAGLGFGDAGSVFGTPSTPAGNLSSLSSTPATGFFYGPLANTTQGNNLGQGSQPIPTNVQPVGSSAGLGQGGASAAVVVPQRPASLETLLSELVSTLVARSCPNCSTER